MSVYCGLLKPPSGSRRGSMAECYSRRQVRYWGKHRVDKSLLLETKVSLKNKVNSVLSQIAHNRGAIHKLKYDRERTADPDKKEAFKKEINSLIEEQKNLVDEYNKLIDA